MSSRSSQNAKQRDKARVQLHSHSFNQTNSSDSDTAPHGTLHKKKAPLSPITEVNSPLLSDVLSRTDYFDKPSTRLTNGKGFASSEDLDLIAPTDKLTSKHSKSVDSMHSSQMPAERPALTKGAAVNKMIKRLSIERLSPPPQVIQAGGFSYTHPQLSPSSSPTKHKSLSPPLTKPSETSHNDIVYAQVVCNELKSGDGSKRAMSKETVHSTLKTNRESASPPPNPKPSTHVSNSTDSVDHFVTTASSPARTSSYQPIKIVTDFDRLDDIEQLVVADEPIIKPNIRHQIPRYASNTNVSYQQPHEDELDQPYEMRDMDFGHDLSLSNRREILESRIKSRIGGLQHDYARRTSTSPTIKRYHRHGSAEIIERFSPETKHSPSPNRSHADSTLRKKSSFYSKQDKGDSGIEVDTVTRNNRKNKYSSRFNIG